MNFTEEHKYDDIIGLSHPVSARHPRMPLLDRAAQFSPFAALTAHGAAIRETERLTDAFVELDESRKEQLDEYLRLVKESQHQRPEIEVIYFCPDPHKSGGAYVTFQGRVKKVDAYNRSILFTDGTEISVEKIYSISGIASEDI